MTGERRQASGPAPMRAAAAAAAAAWGRMATLLLAAACLLAAPAAGNRPPSFSKDMDQLVLSEAAAVGSVVYQLAGSDPEGSLLRFGLAGTDRFEVDATSGEVRVARPLDREQNDTLRFFVTLEDQVEGGGGNNVVQVPVTVIVLDENDNPPVFRGIPYEVTVPEDTAVGSTLFSGVQVEDLDLVGENLEVSCSDLPQFPDACSKFEVVTLNASERAFHGTIVLRQQLDYSVRQFYQMSLVATDGKHESRTPFEVRVEDVQNTPPVFVGSLAGVVHEDAPIGSLIMTVQARDGDRGRPRKITYQLVTNPLNYFLLDPETGELRTAKPLDKEALQDSTGVLTISVRSIDGHKTQNTTQTILKNNYPEINITVPYCRMRNESSHGKQSEWKDINEREVDIVLKACSVLSKLENKYSIFGDYVASEIQNLSSEYLQKKLKRKIQQAILEVYEEEEQILKN